MNRLYRLPLRTRAKNLSSGVRRRRNSSKILVTSLLAVGALAVLVVIGLAAIFTFKHLAAKPKAIAAATPSPATAHAGPQGKRDLVAIVRPQQGYCRRVPFSVCNSQSEVFAAGVDFDRGSDACSVGRAP